MLHRLLVMLAAATALASTAAHADEPFYKGKRLTLLINFAPGGPTDVEGRLLAKHIANHIDGNPLIIVQNKDGASGMVGAAYLGEVGPKDGTMFGYLTGTAWNYVIDPVRSGSISAPTNSSARSPAMPSITCGPTRRPA